MREPIRCTVCGRRFYEGEAHECINPNFKLDKGQVEALIGWDEKRYAAREAFLVEENVRLKAEAEQLKDLLSASQASADMLQSQMTTLAYNYTADEKRLKREVGHLQRACQMAYEELTFGGDWETARGVIRAALARVNHETPGGV